MAMTPLPAAPSRATPATFATTSDTFVAALPGFVTEANALQADVVARQTDVTTKQSDITTRQSDVVTRQADVVTRQTDVTTKQAAAAASAASALNAPGTSATCSTSLTIGTGTQSFTLDQTGKAFALGQIVVLASTASPAIQMIGPITAFNSGTGAISFTATYVAGSGTFSSWTIALSGPQGPAGVTNPALNIFMFNNF